MENKRTFLLCDRCKNLVGLISDGGGELYCCGEPMRSLKAGESDAAAEKHVPVYQRNGRELHVEVGSAPHPMTQEHHIAWIAVCQGDSMQRKALEPGGPAVADFIIEDGSFTIYAYCNLHGLWENKA